MPARHYAQCQMTMLATECDQMLLMVYTPRTTSAYLVRRHDQWAQRMLAWLSLLNSVKISPTPGRQGALLAALLPKARAALIQESVAGHRKYSLLGRIDSYNNLDQDSGRFLE